VIGAYKIGSMYLMRLCYVLEDLIEEFYISLPDIEEREEILKLYLKKKPHRVDIAKIANQTVGFSASALSTFVNEAALFAIREGKDFLDEEDFEAVKDKVISGKRRVITLLNQEKKVQAVYQSGIYR